MKHLRFVPVSTLLLMVLVCRFSHAQGGATSSLSGVVLDPSGAVIPGAEVTARNDATSAQFKTTTAANGTFFIPALSAGTYTATVGAPKFKQAIVKGIELAVGVPASMRVTLEVGGSSETVVVLAGGDIVHTATANVTSTLSINQIANLPLISRNSLDYLVFLPGVDTTTISGSATINGLPRSTINITIDGINTQDNFAKGINGNGLFSMIRPAQDAVEEVTVSTATPGAEISGQGAVQIKFVTRHGDNDFHGSLYEYHRNPVFSANYWFYNRDKTPPEGVAWTPDWKAPKDRILQNQYGGRVGGPIILPKAIFGPLGFNGRDRAFFFINYEEFRQPSQATRTKTIFNPVTQQGIFQYTSAGATVPVDLLALAAAKGPDGHHGSDDSEAAGRHAQFDGHWKHQAGDRS